MSYAQNFEDVMLWRALRHVTNGRYIDVGASDPVIDSVSLAFYERGWRGTHVEPMPHHAASLRRARPDERVLETALSDQTGWIDFFTVIEGDGLSTADRATAERYRQAGWRVQQSRVPCRRLAEVLDAHEDGEVHWLKIDVETLEEQVIRGWPPSKVRPWIVVVESSAPAVVGHPERASIDSAPKQSHAGWQPLLFDLGYRLVYCDGLNRFYVSAAHQELAAAFTCGPNIFDRFALNPRHWARAQPKVAKAVVPIPPLAPDPTARRAPLRLLRRLCMRALRSARTWVCRRPWLKARLLGVLHRLPRLLALVARAAKHLRTQNAAPWALSAETAPPAVRSAHRLLQQARKHTPPSSF